MNKEQSVLRTILAVNIALLTYLILPKANDFFFKKDQSNGREKVNVFLKEIEKRYVDSVDFKSISEVAIKAALKELDPHSVYMPAQDLKEADNALSGNFDGIGIQFNVPNDTAIVIDVIKGGPSERIGLQQGDRIIRVDQNTIAGVKCPQDSMVRQIKGPAGSKVKITVIRDKEEINFDITRGKIPLKSVEGSFMIDSNTGYVRLSKFSRTTFKEFIESSANLLEKGMKNMILDLRDNSGGYLDQSLLLCEQFLEKGQNIVYTEGLHSKRQDYIANGNGFLKNINLYVLINENSASSSEIVAGAIQDNDRGIIIGRRSFGKGLVQEPLMFSDGSGLRLTIARFHTPSGRCIQKHYKGDGDDYYYDILKRYRNGELINADSIKVEKNEKYFTRSGRVVYGGGGIIPDIFVPIDTSKASDFFINCNRKTTQMRFAAHILDRYKSELIRIDNYPELINFLDKIGIEQKFLTYAFKYDKLKPKKKEWEDTKSYLLPQLRALIGRYSKIGDEAFYKLYFDVDDVVIRTLKTIEEKELSTPTQL